MPCVTLNGLSGVYAAYSLSRAFRKYSWAARGVKPGFHPNATHATQRKRLRLHGNRALDTCYLSVPVVFKHCRVRSCFSGSYLVSIAAASDATASDVSDGRDDSRASVREREQQRQAHAHGTRTTSRSQRNSLSCAIVTSRTPTIMTMSVGVGRIFESVWLSCLSVCLSAA